MQMPDIRYVCISDMHLGADNSVLTHIPSGSRKVDPMTTGAALNQLVACLKDLLSHNESQQKPILVLNGDILEMALADINVAAMMFERFIELAFPKDGDFLFQKNILFLPGNHDHHLWEQGRETQYTDFLAHIPPGSPLAKPWHTTKIMPANFTQIRFLTTLIQRYPGLQDAVVDVLYPNYALINSNKDKCIVFSHGHYIEPLYSLMSTLNTLLFPNRQKPQTIDQLEGENFAWIDFFWSTMGRSGDAGDDVNLIYDKLKDQEQIKLLLGNLVHGLLQKPHGIKWFEGLEDRILHALLDITIGRVASLERNQPDQLLSPNALHGLQWFIEGPLLEQVVREGHPDIPTMDMTFIFGHTHKPFSQNMNFKGYLPGTKVYNSGGWVVDSLKPAPIFGGAIILIDETLQTASLRMYNEADSVAQYAVRVEEAQPSGSTSTNTFADHLKTLIQPASDPWKTFSVTMAEAVQVRAQIIQAKISM
jgi:hypothetical protein